jgi:alpha-L-fucosidase 2
MVFGAVDVETIQLNEATLWTGHPHAYANPTALTHLDEIRRLIFNDEVEKAATLADTMLGAPSELMAYQPFCDLQVSLYCDSHFSDYRRVLDIDTAVTSVVCANAASEFSPAVEYRREAFVSFPDQVFVLHMTGSGPGLQTCKISLGTPHPQSQTQQIPNGDLRLTGQLIPQLPPKGAWIGRWDGLGLKYAAQVRVIAQGGKVQGYGDHLFVSGADEITLLVALGTGFRSFRDVSADPLSRIVSDLDAAAGRGYEELRRRHINDYRSLFGRVELELGGGETQQGSADDVIARADLGNNPALFALFYQVGRYLLISSSRPGGQPANLQGIWNNSLWPWWGAKWTININLQMNYWLSETGNLAECAEPLYDLLDDLTITGSEVALAHYACRGFVCHHNTDIWRAAAPVDGFWGLWPVGGAWLVLQAWEHFAFTHDLRFLRRLYPMLEQATRFLLDYLVAVPEGRPFAGCLVTVPSSSPENFYVMDNGTKGFLTYAPTMDLQIATELFQRFIEVSISLGVDPELRARARAAIERLPPLQIGPTGELQEWIVDYAQSEAEHRHISHLYGLFPGSLITPRTTPKLAAAARRTLELRGDAEGGGSCFKAFRALLWSRLGEGDNALRILGKLLTQSTAKNLLNDAYHQIDGHLGGPAAIGEMLLQSHSGEISLLPALPEVWSSGFVRGMRARGGASLEFSWSAGKLDYVVITPHVKTRLRIRYAGKVVDIAVEPTRQYRFDGQLVRSVQSNTV